MGRREKMTKKSGQKKLGPDMIELGNLLLWWAKKHYGKPRYKDILRTLYLMAPDLKGLSTDALRKALKRIGTR